MFAGKKFLGVIPARGGSKGLPRKNILPLAGRPLIAWSIDAAKHSRFLDCVTVSTDSAEIASVAKEWGAYVPELRAEHLATDAATTVAVVQNWLEVCEKRNECVYDFVVILQPTSPFRTAKHIDQAIESVVKKGADSLASFCQASTHPLWMVVPTPAGTFEPFLKQDIPHQRQGLKEIYQYNGALYIVSRELIQRGLLESEHTLFFEMDSRISVDIDDAWDFKWAEFVAIEMFPAGGEQS
jgi:CMP-N,N'-diacetyllegionaminic acid synthase